MINFTWSLLFLQEVDKVVAELQDIEDIYRLTTLEWAWNPV